MVSSICLSAKLLDRKGHKLGKIRCLVADKDKHVFTNLVAEITMQGYCTKVIDAADIKWLSPDGCLIQLGLYSDEIENLPDYLERDFNGAENNFAEVPYSLLAGGGIFPWVFNRAYFSPLPDAMTTSEGSILVKQAFLEKVHLPDNSLQFHENSCVVGEDGKKIGYLKSLSLEFFSGKIKSVTIKKGFFHGHTETFEWETVKKVTRESIKVSFKMDDLKQAAFKTNRDLLISK